MSTRDLKHFLVVYDIRAGKADVVPFDVNYDAALEAYNRAEEKYRDDPNVEVVLLGSDSIETVERTHSSYFELSEAHIDQIVARELAELGLS
jgi:hypothetical protein